jgi:hypothetical protein
VTNIFIPVGATYSDSDTKPLDNTTDQHGVTSKTQNP